MNSVFKQNPGFSATIPEFIINRPTTFGAIDIFINQRTLQEEGVTVPLFPYVVVSEDTNINVENTEDDKDLSYFYKCIDSAILLCGETGLVPKIIVWTKSAVITGYFEARVREKYTGALVGSMTANTPYKERDHLIEKFRAADVLSVIFNYDIISEGTSIDGTTDTIVGRNLGQIKIIQIGGRSIRLHSIDRIAIVQKKITPLVADGWIKPNGRIWFYQESDSLESIETTNSNIALIHELNNAGVINLKDVRFVKKPKGGGEDTTENIMEDPEEPDPKFVQAFFDKLKVLQYNATTVRSFSNLNLITDDGNYAKQLLSLFRT